MFRLLTSKGALFLFGLLSSTALLLGFFVVSSARAQVTGATMSGTVTDPSGAVVPNAQVVIKDTATGVTRNVKTDSSGLYTAPNLLPGPYRVTVSAPGFSTRIQSGITLTVGGQQVLNMTLQVGKVTNLVQVTSAAPQVQLSSSAISNVVNSTTVRALPLNGRSWTDLALLSPGVNNVTALVPFNAGSARGNRGYGGQATIGGVRPQFNNYRIDGISIMDYSNGSPGSVLGGNLGVDAVQEFSVMTTNYSAEYGRTAGGVINAITKSGTNQFHGDVYEFLRNGSLDASNFFDNFSNLQKPSFRRNQFGASAGGPIQKNKTFIFGDYEGIRQAEPVAQVDSTPSAAARAGNLSSGAVTVDPAAAKYLALYPLPNSGVTTGDTGIYSFEQSHIVTENYVSTRLDHTISGKDSIFGTFEWDKTPYSSPDSFNNVLLSNLTLTARIALEETHIFSPTMVNSFRAGYNRSSTDDSKSVSAINPAAADLSLDSVPGRNAAQLAVGGLTQMTGGVNGINTYLYRWNDYQVYDDAFKTVGTHSIKFGARLERIQDYVLAANNPNGAWSFGSLAAFLTNNPSKFNAGFPSTLTPRGLRQSVLGAYIQDDWRYRPNLTLNLGLRYEIASNLTEVQGKLVNLLSPYSTNPHLGNPLYPNNPTLHDLEPRVGFAWDPFHNGKTSVRGGCGMFDVLPLPYLANTKQVGVAPFFKQGFVNTPPGAFFTGAFPLLGPKSFQSAYNPYGPRMYTMQWNMSVQRQLSPNMTLMLAYVGEKGTHIPFTADDGDDVIPVQTSAGYLFPNPVTTGTTLNPNFGALAFSLPQANCFFDALEAQLTKRMSHGLQVQGSFTWGRSIDTNSASVAGDQFADGISSLQWFDQRLTRGPSDFNVGRNLTVNAVWNVPTPKSLSGPAAWLAKGWQLNGILTSEDGAPFTASFGTDGDPQGINNSDPWAFPNRLTGSGCGTLVNPGNPNNYIKTQCFALPTAPSLAYWSANCDTTTPFFGAAGTPEPFPNCFNLRGNSGRNVIAGPGIDELDFSVFKNNYISRISENFDVQFRAEFFNILNRANFALPVAPDHTDIFVSNGEPTGVAGLLTSTATSSREIQFAIKVIW
ncbi:MAG: carboxypeptidase regulatory-like domain-containing protein [Terriglobia bacterium]